MAFEKTGEVKKGVTPEAPAAHTKRAATQDAKAEADRLDGDFTRALDDRAAARIQRPG